MRIGKIAQDSLHCTSLTRYKKPPLCQSFISHVLNKHHPNVLHSKIIESVVFLKRKIISGKALREENTERWCINEYVKRLLKRFFFKIVNINSFVMKSPIENKKYIAVSEYSLLFCISIQEKRIVF